MATKTVLDATTAERVGIIFNRVAELARSLERRGVALVENADEETVEDAVAARDLAAQIGWLADLGAQKVGGMVMRGDAEKWMLPPSYHWAAERNAEETSQANGEPA